MDLLAQLLWFAAKFVGGAVGLLVGLFLAGVVLFAGAFWVAKKLLPAMGGLFRDACAGRKVRSHKPSAAVRAAVAEVARRKTRMAWPASATPCAPVTVHTVPITIPGVDLNGTGPDERDMLRRRRG